MSLQPYQNPTTAAFRGGYSAEPSGLPTPHEHVDTSVDSRAWAGVLLGCLSVLALGPLLSWANH